MYTLAERKISIADAKTLVKNYLSTIADILDLELKKTEYNYQTVCTTLDKGERVKTIGKIKFLKFNELLELALRSQGYNVLKIEYKQDKYVMTFSLVETVSKSR